MKFKIILLLLITLSAFSQQKIEVFFDFNQDVPNENSIAMLQKWMKENPKVEVVRLSGYCDSVDVSSYNKKLSARRINSVLAILKDNQNINISATCLLEPYGKDFKQSKIQAENRKVVVFYKKEEKQVVQQTIKEALPEEKKHVPEIKKEEKLSETIKTSKIGDLIKLQNLYFFNNSDKIVPKSEPTLKELLDIMKENPKLKIEIQGHICCKTPGQPDEISEARAKMVFEYLRKNRIDKKRLSYKGYGVSKPIHPIPEKNTQEEDENRRVEILIIEN